MIVSDRPVMGHGVIQCLGDKGGFLENIKSTLNIKPFQFCGNDDIEIPLDLRLSCMQNNGTCIRAEC